MKKIVTLAIAAAAALAASPAAAQSIHISDDGDYRAVIPYNDLDLTRPAGIKALEGRIRTAANRVCGTGEARSLAVVRSAKECRDAVMSAARPQLALARQGRTNSMIALGDR